MKRNIIILCTGLFLLACEKKNTATEIIYHPHSNFFNDGNLVKVNLTPQASYKEIYQTVARIHRNDSTPFFELQLENEVIRIMPFASSHHLSTGIHKISITEDSVYSLDSYPIDSLRSSLTKFYGRKKIPEIYRQSPEHILEIDLHMEMTGEDLENKLKDIREIFDEINATQNDSLDLKITLSYFRHLPLPLPPSNN